jgi:hypothetical protein
LLFAAGLRLFLTAREVADFAFMTIFKSGR